MEHPHVTSKTIHLLDYQASFDSTVDKSAMSLIKIEQVKTYLSEACVNKLNKADLEKIISDLEQIAKFVHLEEIKDFLSQYWGDIPFDTEDLHQLYPKIEDALIGWIRFNNDTCSREQLEIEISRCCLNMGTPSYSDSKEIRDTYDRLCEEFKLKQCQKVNH